MFVDKETYRAKAIKKHYALNDRQAEVSDPIHRVVSSLATRLNKELNARGIMRDMTHMKYIGCTRPRLKQHLETQFTQGMTWDNYGEWEVDHDIGICNWDLHDREQLKKCFNFSNLQPLWRGANRSKPQYVNGRSPAR